MGTGKYKAWNGQPHFLSTNLLRLELVSWSNTSHWTLKGACQCVFPCHCPAHSYHRVWLFVAIQYLFIDWVNEMLKIRILTPCFTTCLSTADSWTSMLWHLCWLDSETQPSELGLADCSNFLLSLCRNSDMDTHPKSHSIYLPCPSADWF